MIYYNRNMYNFVYLFFYRYSYLISFVFPMTIILELLFLQIQWWLWHGSLRDISKGNWEKLKSKTVPSPFFATWLNFLKTLQELDALPEIAVSILFSICELLLAVSLKLTASGQPPDQPLSPSFIHSLPLSLPLSLSISLSLPFWSPRITNIPL